MTSLEKRLFQLFDKREIAAGRAAASVRISCPRVGQVRASVTDETGTTHEVLLELSAGRRGGMTLESRSTSPSGRAGTPCAALAATLLEVDRRGLFSRLVMRCENPRMVGCARWLDAGGGSGAQRVIVPRRAHAWRGPHAVGQA